jgi:ferredoxin
MKITSAKVIKGCISCKNCENICPEIFKVAPTSQVISDKFNQNAIKLLMAEKMCPVQVIKVEKQGSYSLETAVATLKSKTYLTLDTLELAFETKNFSFVPGQYVSLQMTDWRGDFSRSYSIAGGDENSFVLTVKLLKKGRGSDFLRSLGERRWSN